jgi:hypothetical protein
LENSVWKRLWTCRETEIKKNKKKRIPGDGQIPKTQ